MAVGGPGAVIRSVAAGRIVVNLVQPAADLLTTYGAGAKVYLERDTTSAFAAPTVVSSTTIVSGTEQLEFVDTSGTSSSWYRVRVGNSGGTTYGDYSDGVQATSVLSYATADDVIETMSVAASDTKAYNLLADLVIDASDYISRACKRTFYRSPQVSGTEVRVYNVVRPRERTLSRAIGQDVDIISLSTVEAADTVSGSYTTIASGATGYYTSPDVLVSGFPYEDIYLSPEGASYTRFPSGGLVRLTGAFGWPSVPPLIKRATIDLAREWYRQGPGGGGPIGTSALGQPIFQRGNPPSVDQAISMYRRVSFTVVD